MNHSYSLLILVLGCGGQTVPSNQDAGNDAAAPINECHGYCPQPNGAPCTNDCDCTNKCLLGKDTPAKCADPIVPSIPCGDAAACPSGQSCGPFGTCEGATCSANNECPVEQQCVASVCVAMGCL